MIQRVLELYRESFVVYAIMISMLGLVGFKRKEDKY